MNRSESPVGRDLKAAAAALLLLQRATAIRGEQRLTSATFRSRRDITDLIRGSLGPSEPPDPFLRDPPESNFCDLSKFGDLAPIELQRSTITEGRTHPVWQLTGYRVTEIRDGYCRARIPSSRWFSNGSLSIYGGLLAWAADFTMGAAVYSTLPVGDIFATLDMHIRFTRPAPIDSGDLTIAATVRHQGRQLRVSSCEISSEEGKRVAMATGSALIIAGGARELSEGKRPEDVLARAAKRSLA